MRPVTTISSSLAHNGGAPSFPDRTRDATAMFMNAARRAVGAPRRSGAGRRGPRERRRPGSPARVFCALGWRWGVRRGEAPRSRT